ncbi:tRNA 5-methoxyuridine(34)/uridine 5-oxyacetic acid(34) synthase CmoB [Campylobacter sp. MIT 97-5078]|uniref:tRNA 5-methoxyuridine(34)/uridine 5-oxyacetic acid(34) synthase CmoB n=1 Tax=Campylobacter sp. MIT 97-5078 TaxID=1548153 RepID=UPI0009DE5063|nr:tRNA 5-methoxyuridine(34)/uridine 5-oxyacetic acid(34) synthase CmoB [Campylobacter sp. MIT 97-5078]TQR27959.1 tRNA 5-methoxyuridine(34)/uridine 5-oxyacetic acid(34) synthase CmoB [Campylobacter sp. MIT 97-5078]
MNNIQKQLLENKEFKAINELNHLLTPDFKANLSFNEAVNLNFDETHLKHSNLSLKALNERIKELALRLKPWRKGPFKVNELFIDSEWQSFVKFNILKPFMNNLENKIVADVGCNNGYYMFKMLEFKPAKIIGFDPCLRPFLQFYLLNTLAKSKICFELLGVEDLSAFCVQAKLKFDFIFCLGVLYHRSNPLQTLKQLKSALNKGGSVFLDTIYIEDEREIALIPRKTYSKIANIFFIPSILGLRNWCEKAGFSHFEVLATRDTDEFEQRTTAWSEGYSLKDFLSEEDHKKTLEGYDAPKRVYVKLKV